MNLNDNNRDLILALQAEPLASYAVLSKKLNLAPATVKRRLKQLWAQNDQKSVVVGIAGILDNIKMDLSTTTFLIDMDTDIPNLNKILELGENHPYTHYQNRIFGSITGFIIQFSTPIGSEHQLGDLFSKITDDLGIAKIESFVNPDLVVNCYPDVSVLLKRDWNFDFHKWFETEEILKENAQTISKFENVPEVSEYHDFIELGHIIVARELMMNARRKQINIMSSIGENNQYNEFEKKLFYSQRDVSRYFDFINRYKLISHYQLLYNRNKFGVYHQFCLTGELKSGYKQQISNLLGYNKDFVPFRMGVSFKENYYFIYMEAPVLQTNNAMDFFQSISKTMNTMVLDGSFSYQRNYPIWHRNYIGLDKGWKWNTSRDWMINLPITNTLN